jgi:hypothetical protein
MWEMKLTFGTVLSATPFAGASRLDPYQPSTVYRVEHAYAREPSCGRFVGPYNTYGQARSVPNCEVYQSEDDRHPLPQSEGHDMRQHDVCAFISLDQLRAWFSDDVRTWLRDNGYVVRKYECRARALARQAVVDTRQPMYDRGTLCVDTLEPPSPRPHFVYRVARTLSHAFGAERKSLCGRIDLAHTDASVTSDPRLKIPTCRTCRTLAQRTTP